MTWQAWTALLVPLLITGVFGPILAYRMAVKNAQKVADTAQGKLDADRETAKAEHRSEGRRMDLSEWQAMTGDLRSEIDRLRADHLEDRKDWDVRMGRLRDRLDQLEQERIKLEAKVLKLENWAREVIDALRLPEVASVLLQHEILIPPPPLVGDRD